MFNLLISGNEDAFDGKPWTLERPRVFEHTSDAIKQRYQDLDNQQLSELYNFPTLFAFESGIGKNARLGRIERALMRQGEVRIEYSFVDGLPEITSEQFQALRWELEVSDGEYNRTHWAVKDVDLAAELISAGLINQDQLDDLAEDWRLLFSAEPAAPPMHIQPTVFKMPTGTVEPDLVSMMLPLSADFGPVFDTVSRAGLDLGLRVLNANQVWEETEIIQDIFSLIFRSKFVVCDFSGRNPNVFYEAGIAHTLGRTVIPIVQNIDDIPFDLRHHRHVVYLNNEEGRRALLEALVPRMTALAEK